MKTYQPTSLGRSIVRFFQEYLPTLRGMSQHTIRSYRDGMILFLGFAARDRGPSVPMMMRHLPPGSLDPKARKDSLIHAHAVPRE